MPDVEPAPENYVKEELVVGLTDNEKSNLINSMEVIEHSISCGEIEYVLVEDTKENREILYKIGFDDTDIEDECYPDGGYLDISPIAFKYADWYSGKTNQFSIDKPKEGIL